MHRFFVFLVFLSKKTVRSSDKRVKKFSTQKNHERRVLTLDKLRREASKINPYMKSVPEKMLNAHFLNIHFPAKR